MISSVFGGALVVSKKTLSVHGDDLLSRYRDKSRVSRAWILKQLLHPILTWFSITTYHLFWIGKLIHYIGSKIGLLSKATSKEEKACGVRPLWINASYPGVLAQMALSQFIHIDDTNMKRGQIAALYQEAEIPCAQVRVGDGERVWLRYPVYVQDPVSVLTKSLSKGVILGDWYNQVIAPKEVNLSATGYVAESCPVAEESARHIINLPVYPRMTENDADRVVTSFTESTHGD